MKVAAFCEKLVLPTSGFDTDENMSGSLSASLAKSLALIVMDAPTFTLSCGGSDLGSGGWLPGGAAVTVTMIHASEVRPWLLLTLYWHRNVPFFPRGSTKLIRSSAVTDASPPLGHTGVPESCGFPPDGSLSLASTSMLTGLSVKVSAKSSRANGALGNASASTVTVTVPMATLPWPSPIL